MRVAVVVVLFSTLFLSGCPFGEEACNPVPDEKLGKLPEKLSETGIFADITSGTPGDGVMPFEPQFPLWSDGAEKRRWIFLPPGTQIDTADVDNWRFPEGTKLWKEFTRDGKRIETRLLQKVGPSDEDWVAVAYVWSDDLSDATKTPDGVKDAKGTGHDVPSAVTCTGCHEGTHARVLGFSSVQLSYDAAEGDLDLDDLHARGLLTSPVSRLDIPGNDVERRSLGYLHANCSHCHNSTRPDAPRSFTLGPLSVVEPMTPDQPRCYNPWSELDLALRSGELDSVDSTATYQTAIDGFITKGDPDHSELVIRMKQGVMPRLAVEIVDQEGVQLLSDWISQMH